jgi:hypothetical protein
MRASAQSISCCCGLARLQEALRKHEILTEKKETSSSLDEPGFFQGPNLRVFAGVTLVHLLFSGTRPHYQFK